ncbi:MAG: hypothetical protein Kow0075_10590 [Salibacteraceae bacterium]
MMRLFAILVTFAVGHVYCVAQSSDFVQKQFYEAAEKPAQRRSFLEYTAMLDTTNHTLLAYRGAALALMATQVFNPIEKWRYFKRGTQMIDRAISREPQNAELRSIRFLLQQNSPQFLNYRSQMDADLNIIQNHLEQHGDEVWETQIKRYLTKSET